MLPRSAWEVQLAVLSFGFLCMLVSLGLGIRISYQGFYEPADFARGPRVSFQRFRERMVAYLLGALVIALNGIVMMGFIGSALRQYAPGAAGAGVAVLFLVHVGLFAAMNAKVASITREIELFGQ